MAAKKKAGLSDPQKVGIGVGLTAAAAAAAGTYFLYGSQNASKNRKTVKGWAAKAQDELSDALDKAKDMTQEEYEALVDTVSAAYTSAKGATKPDITGFKKEMKAQWQNVSMAMQAAAKKKSAKKAVKKVVKKAVKKAVVKKVASVKKAASPKKAAPAKKAVTKSAPAKKAVKKAAPAKKATK